MTALRLFLAAALLLPREAAAQVVETLRPSSPRTVLGARAVAVPIQTINFRDSALAGVRLFSDKGSLGAPQQVLAAMAAAVPAATAAQAAWTHPTETAQPAPGQARVQEGLALHPAPVAGLARPREFFAKRQDFQERNAPAQRFLAEAAQVLRRWPSLSSSSALQAYQAGQELEAAITQAVGVRAAASDPGRDGHSGRDPSPPGAKLKEKAGEAKTPAASIPRPIVKRSPPHAAEPAFKSPWKAAASPWGTLKKMLRGNDEVRPFVHKYKKELWLARGLLIGYSALSTVLAYGMGKLVDLAAEGHEMSYGLKLLIASTAGVVAINVLYAVAEWLHIWIWERLDHKVLKDFRGHFYAHVIALSVGFLRKHKPQHLAIRFSDDVSVLMDNNVHIPISLPHYVLEFVFSSAMLFFVDWRLALGIWLTMPVFAILATVFGNRLEALGEKYSDKRAEMAGHVSDTISNVEMIKIYGSEAAAEELVSRSAGELTQIGIQEAYVSSRYHALISSLGDFATKLFVIILAAFALFFYGKPSVGTITSMQEWAFSIKYAISGLSETWTRYREGEGSTKRVLDLLTAKPEITDAPDAVELGPIQGNIRFENVRFSYNNKTNVLKDLSFEVKPGQVVAFVGAKGSGKTTIIRLLARLYDPQKGSISIDGHDLRKIKRASLTRQLGYVPQDSGLLDGTIRQNLLFVKPDATEMEMRAALAAAHADFVFDSEAFEHGLETDIGDKGARLSGGQKQSIAIARAILRDPRLLLLDEATASFDNESERRVQAAMKRLMEGRTTFLVAHRLTTVQNADRIFVLDKGQIVESGTHAELMALQGKYHALWTAPSQGGEQTIDRTRR